MVQEKTTIFEFLLDQNWLPLLILGGLVVGFRLYNVKQKLYQRQLLREIIVTQLQYREKKIGKKIT